jgi:tripartite-type tricarboxylate transporter receptor subunit TctC
MRNHYSSVIFCVLALAGNALAQEPSLSARPVRFVVPFGPGGGGDTVARVLSQKLGPALSTPVVVENRPGAGGTLGTDIVAKAPPDGYTILLGNVGPLAIAGSLYKSLPYDPVGDFAPISLVVTYPNVLVVHPSVPARNVKELILLARAHPGDLMFASAGNGSSTHLAGELLKSMAKVQMRHVPYKTAAQAVTDVIAGHVNMYFSSVVGALPHTNSGKLRALAVTSTQRSDMMPSVPTIAESGFPSYEAVNWLGVLAPKGTPKPLVDRLYGVISAALKQPDVQARLAEEGTIPVGNSPEAFAAYISAEIRKWSAVVRESKASAD